MERVARGIKKGHGHSFPPAEAPPSPYTRGKTRPNPPDRPLIHRVTGWTVALAPVRPTMSMFSKGEGPTG